MMGTYVVATLAFASAQGGAAAFGSRLWPVLPSHVGSTFVALGRVNRQFRHLACLGSGSTFRMKH